MRVRRFIAPVLAATVLVVACKKEVPPPPAPTGPTPEEIAQRRADSIAKVRAAEEAAARRKAAADSAAAAAHAKAVAAARATLEQMVFFDFDKSTIRDDAAATLRQKVDVLRASPEVHLRIEGYADERGSTEYNLALGERRAEAVRDFLTGYGLDASRFTVFSYGEAHPLDPGHDEEAWAKNRRDQFVITAGADAINPPNG